MDQKRLVRVTAGNLRQNHLYIRDLRDFFPPDIFGPPKREPKGRAAVDREANHGIGSIEIILDGLNETITTDIGRDAKTGKPRGFLRDRRSIGLVLLALERQG